MQYTSIEIIKKDDPEKILYLRKYKIDPGGEPTVYFTPTYLYSWIHVPNHHLAELSAYFERSGEYLPVYWSWKFEDSKIVKDEPRFCRASIAAEPPEGVTIVIGGLPAEMLLDRLNRLARANAPKLQKLTINPIISEAYNRNKDLVSMLSTFKAKARIPPPMP